MVIEIRNSKGGEDRYVPLPRKTLDLLRKYWLECRSESWLFPSKTKDGHITNSSIQWCFKVILHESGITKHASVHTLRHSYATHLLESGIDIRIIQGVLGHKNPKSTMIYTHLTRKIVKKVQNTVDKLMFDI